MFHGAKVILMIRQWQDSPGITIFMYLSSALGSFI